MDIESFSDLKGKFAAVSNHGFLVRNAKKHQLLMATGVEQKFLSYNFICEKMFVKQFCTICMI